VEERHGEAFELGDQLTVIGSQLTVGAPAPEFALSYLDPEDGVMKTMTLADSVGHVRVLNIVNSLDTPICHVETQRWEKIRADLPPDVVIYTVSMDLPYAQARWNQAEGVKHLPLSAHKSEQFGQDYGVLIKEWRLLQRAVVVIDRSGRIAYAEYVPDQMTEPNYNAAIEAVRQAEDSAGD
jgi:thioredoxin-dependent peroxiredoxin